MALFQIRDERGHKLTTIERDDDDLTLPEGYKIEPADASPTWLPPPTDVSPLQMRRALRATGLKDGIVAFVATQDDETREAWEYATVIQFDNPLIALAAAAMDKNESDVEELFRLAATL